MESISPVYSAATEKRYSPPWADLSIIGIAGSSGSGKTSVAMEIVKSLNLPWVVILVMDSFYKSLDADQHAKAHRNEFDFDCPDAIDFDALVDTLKDLKQGIMDMLDVKIFVEADMDVCLGRRNIIIPRGIENKTAIDMVVKHIQRKLEEKSEKHSADLRELKKIASELQLSPNVLMMPQTPQFIGMNTILQNPDTEQVDFVFYFDRLASLLIEKALDSAAYDPSFVQTPQGTTYDGLNPAGVMSAVAVLRGGSCLETALKRTIPDCITGRVLIQTNARNEEPELHYLKLPDGIETHATVMLMDPQMASGGAALMAVRILIDHGVEEKKIVFVTCAAGKIGLKRLTTVYPNLKVIVGRIEEEREPRWIEKRYFGC
ncbi:Uridine kinase [Aspergillus melleus]|uniref:Uridine kinase n=1 Tax=Aspergillus melleus TaxID=138277 RepID=A0ACC3BCF2_9EURO|nr:Uridine kinase [Aspergillus melleus]